MNPVVQMKIALAAYEIAKTHDVPAKDQLTLICRLTNPEFPKWIFEDGWFQIAVANVKASGGNVEIKPLAEVKQKPIGLELTNRESEQLAKELQEPAPASEAFKAGSKKPKKQKSESLYKKMVSKYEVLAVFKASPDNWFTSSEIRKKHNWFLQATTSFSQLHAEGKLDRRGEKGSYEYRFAQPKNEAPDVTETWQAVESHAEPKASSLSPVEKAVLDYLRTQDGARGSVAIARGIKASKATEVVHALRSLTDAGLLVVEKDGVLNVWRIA